MGLIPDVEPTELSRVVRHAKDVNREHVGRLFNDSIDKYVGRFFSQKQAGRIDDPTNTRFEFIGLFLAEVANGSPRWGIGCNVTGPGEQIADALQIGMADHAKENRYGTLAQRLAVDFCLSHAICATFPQRMPDRRNLMGGAPLFAPVSVRIDQERAFHDVTDSSVSYMETGFRGHTVIANRRLLTADGGWNQDAISRLAEYSEDTEINVKRSGDWSGRDAVAYDVVYVPHATLEMVRALGYDTSQYERDIGERPYLYNGWMFYITQAGKEDSGEFLKPPEPFFGPAMGPYVRFDGYPVPGSTYNGSTMTFTAGQQEIMNQAERAVIDAEERYKVILAYAAENAVDAAALTSAKSGEAVPIANMYREGQNVLQRYEFGGADPNMYNSLERRRQSTDRNVGLSDEQKGNSKSGATATASSIAASSGQARVGWQAGKFYDGMNDVGYQNCWYMVSDPQYAHLIPQMGRKGRFVQWNDDGTLAPIPDPVYHGGIDDDDPFSMDDLSVKFDYMSVRHKTEESRLAEATDTAQLVLNAAPLMAQLPFVRWDEFWEYQGESRNQPWLETLFNYKSLEEVTGIQMEREADVTLSRNAKPQTQFNLAAPTQQQSGPVQPQPQPAGVDNVVQRAGN